MKRTLLNKLEGSGKDYLSIPDLEKILKAKRRSLYVILTRLVKEGWLVRLNSGVYITSSQAPDLEKIANQLYNPSYLSFESTLSQRGVLSQIPYTLTFATTSRTRKIQLGEQEVLYRHLKPILFTGYHLTQGVFIAEPEKAFLDLVYMVSLKREEFDWKRLDLKRLKRNSLKKWMKLYPARTQKIVRGIL